MELPKNVINLNQLIKKAYKNKYALLHVNIMNVEWAKAVLEAANETHSPIIVAATKKNLDYLGGYETFTNLIKSLVFDLKIKVPVVIHLDHGTYDEVKAAINAGFTSVMFDGSKLPFAKNYQQTKELLALAKKSHVSFEAEVGIVGGKETDVISGSGELADVQQCQNISQLGITCLAAGIGNIHGIYPTNWTGLNFDRLKQISKAVNYLPLALHGGSGIPVAQVKQAIALGVSKLNINTECSLVFSTALMDFYQQHSDRNPQSKWFDIRIAFIDPIKAIKKVILDKLILSGSFNKA